LSVLWIGKLDTLETWIIASPYLLKSMPEAGREKNKKDGDRASKEHDKKLLEAWLLRLTILKTTFQ